MLVLAGAAHGAPVAPTAMNATVEHSCSKSNLEKHISAYSHSTISECFAWRDVDSARFSMRWRSFNKDAVKISYGWCPDRCSSYRSSSCTWGSERYEKGTNFEQSLSATVNNRHYKNPVSCVEVKCDNWHETCQLEISSVSVSSNSAEDEFVDKSLPPSDSGALVALNLAPENGRQPLVEQQDRYGDGAMSPSLATAPVVKVEAVVKNATLALGSSCASYYELRGGVKAQFRGNYEEYNPASTSCNGKPVYRNKGQDVFLYFSSNEHWEVGPKTSMNTCGGSCWIYSAGDCECPSGSGCQGKWMQATGQKYDQQMCSAEVWCPDCGLWWI
eukprot:COSAG02_NODE_35_length_49339_cov_20.375102_19_plen_330_part_00